MQQQQQPQQQQPMAMDQVQQVENIIGGDVNDINRIGDVDEGLSLSDLEGLSDLENDLTFLDS